MTISCLIDTFIGKAKQPNKFLNKRKLYGKAQSFQQTTQMIFHQQINCHYHQQQIIKNSCSSSMRKKYTSSQLLGLVWKFNLDKLL